ncbi:diguanylate cyclase domain-containing protein [Quisquiliibacterium transsilvanicum]|uniref:Diguanylate cyclase (GGDEF)-like protein/PAS domain S-box-containing protein n=1 Tax=Quisquiliibacterium transsilvanicum TaxID=1549638 RepID=A0A7W8HMF8_9BURK|nr:diguanylate cyclase [Quisquiliibacterium transsilvanicum]MBB5273750.1 diguanylate cyclase (GGDEF)-like protein/PAS domain S-box-containing protein [Quisquiliibacterium transsilvanicum]
MPDTGTTDANTHEVSGSIIRLVADSVPALMAYYEWGSLRCRFANRRYAEYNGWTPETILGKTVREVIGEQAWAMIEPQVDAVCQGNEVRYVRRQTLPDGAERIVEVNLVPHCSAEGSQLGAVVLINDITDHWMAERTIRDSEERLRKFMYASSEGILFHRDGLILDVNDALVRLLGYPASDLIGRKTLEFVPARWHSTVYKYVQARNEEPFEAEALHRDGRTIPVELVGKAIGRPGDEQRLVVVRDITARKQAQERIEFLALHDPLTELPNRLYLNEYLPRILAQARRQGQGVAVMFIDLDGFKPVNDTLGHDAGDALLCAVARRLRSAVRESDLVARFGGDEFLVILTGVVSAHDVERAARALLEAVRAPISWRDGSIALSMSVGVSLFPRHGETGGELIRSADAAMYLAKTEGGNRWRLGARPPALP